MSRYRKHRWGWYFGMICVILGVALFIFALVPFMPRAAWHFKNAVAWVRAYPYQQDAPPMDIQPARESVKETKVEGENLSFVLEDTDEAMRLVGAVAEAVLKELEAREAVATSTPPEVSEPRVEFPTHDSPYWLIIPSLEINLPIVAEEKDADKALRQGVWLIPGTPAPPQGGNTVLSGHRFLYTSGARTLYHLDKVALEDKIYIEWQGTRYTYKVMEKNIVPPTEVSILNNTPDPVLTIFTCDPPYSTKNRLYIRARLLQP